MSRKLHFCSFLLGLSIAGYGQWLNDLTWNTSYYGENLTHPGLKMGAEYVYKYKMKEGRKFSRIDADDFTDHFAERRPFRQKGVRVNLAGYYHHSNHTGFHLSAEIVKRRITRRKWTREFTAGVGYLHTFNTATTYVVNDEDEVSTIPLAGWNYFSPQFSVLLGKDYQVKNKNLVSVYGGFTLFGLIPYNHLFNANYSFELGMRYKLTGKQK